MTLKRNSNNTAVMRRALELLDEHVEEDFELEQMTLLYPGEHWSGPVPDGHPVYVSGNRRGFRRHYLVTPGFGKVRALPIDQALEDDHDEVRRIWQSGEL